MRSRVELILRVIGIAALAAWIVDAAIPKNERAVTLRSEGLPDAILRLTSSAPGISVRLDAVPHARERDWLAALADARVPVEWSGDVAPVGIETYPAMEPSGGAFILVSAPSSSAVADSLGVIDTIRTGTEPTLLRVGDVRGNVRLTAARERANAPVAAARQPGRIILAGNASWEAKFLVAALEEAGWGVDARLRVRPDEVVAQGVGGGAALTADTSRHAAVILLDSSRINVRGIEGFVRAGGGLILVGDANRSPLARSLGGWRAGWRESAPLGTLPGDTLWRGLSRIPLNAVDTAQAIVLERRGDAAAIVARRHYAGRVLAVGYDETWRWRMAGDDRSVAEHRAWWSHLAASVALRPIANLPPTTGAAPLAALHAALGPPTAASSDAPAVPRGPLGSLLAAVALAALFTEWLLRRLRGRK